MAANTQQQHHEEEEEELQGDFLDPNDVLQEAPVDGDYPMDEDDEEEGADEAQEGGEGEEDENMVLEDNSIQQFATHRDSVFAISVHPTLPIAASGGADDLGYLWNVTDGEQIAKLTGHTDSVTSTSFSTDGTLVATGGMDGKARIWRKVAGDESGKTWEFLTEITGPDEIVWLRWHPKGNVLLAGSNDSTVWLWQLPSGNTMQVLAGHDSPVQTGNFTPDGKRIVTADANGSLILWDPRSPTPVWKLTPADGRFGLEGGITSLAINPTSSLVVVGGANGGVRVVSLAKGTVVGALEGHKEGESVEAVTFVEFGGAATPGQGSGIVATGGTDGRICVWDLAIMKLRTSFEHQDSVTSLRPHPAPHSHLLTSSSADKTLKTWDARAGKLLKEHLGHQGPVFSSSLGLNGSIVVSASDDGVCLVFSTQ